MPNQITRFVTVPFCLPSIESLTMSPLTTNATFNSLALFQSGPHQLLPHGLTLRHVLQTTPGTHGVRLASQGRSGRAIEQHGYLIADDAEQIATQQTAIENLLDGQAYTLTDGMGRQWTNAIMLTFEAGEIRRVAMRVRMSYRIDYLQVNP